MCAAMTGWTELAELCAGAYRTVAPKRLVQQLDAG
jgi:hypothetical protein